MLNGEAKADTMKRHYAFGMKLAIFGIGLCVIFLPGISKYNQLRQENQKNQETLQELQETNVKLEKEKAMLENDPVYVERRAREKLGVAKKGEVTIKFKE